MVVVVAPVYQCSRCGRPTDWDDSLGPQPLCVSCWDKLAESENPVNAQQRQYRQEHREEVSARQRQYYQEHREEVSARQRQYRQEHREEVSARQRQYRQEHINIKQEVKDEIPGLDKG